jgi:hypothetical protein
VYIISALYDGQGVTSMVRRRALDEKVGVRKAAIQALASIIKLDHLNFNQDVSYLSWTLLTLKIVQGVVYFASTKTECTGKEKF